MERHICIYLEFLTEAHQALIRKAAEETGFVPHFFTLEQFEEAKECLEYCVENSGETSIKTSAENMMREYNLI